MKKTLLVAILLSCSFAKAQDLVFGINPVLLRGGRNKLVSDFFYIEDKDRFSVLGAAPLLRVGITDSIEWRITTPLIRSKNKNPITKETILTQGLSDVITSIKFQPYAYRDQAIGKVTLFTLLAGLNIPGNIPVPAIALAGQAVEVDLVATGTGNTIEFGDRKVGFLVGASTLLATRPYGILSSLLIGIERINECGNRDGNFFIYSFGIGKELVQKKGWNVFGLLEWDWIYESSAIIKNKKVPFTSNHILWFGPNIIIHQATRELKFGIQTPLAKINRQRDYRLFLGFEWEF